MKARCEGCGKSWNVPRPGRQYTCKECGGTVVAGETAGSSAGAGGSRVAARAGRRAKKSKAKSVLIAAGIPVGVLVVAVIVWLSRAPSREDQIEDFRRAWPDATGAELRSWLAPDVKKEKWPGIEKALARRGWQQTRPKLGEAKHEEVGDKNAEVVFDLAGGSLRTTWGEYSEGWRLQAIRFPRYDASADPPTAAAKQALREVLARFEDAWNREDGDAIAALAREGGREKWVRFIDRQKAKRGWLPISHPTADFTSRVRALVRFSLPGGHLRTRWEQDMSDWQVTSMRFKIEDEAAARLGAEGHALDPSTPGRPPKPAPAGEPLSEESVNAWADELVAALRGGDVGAIKRSLELDALLDRVTGELKAPPRLLKSVRTAVRRGFDPGKGIAPWIKDASSLRLLRVRETEEKTVALFRLLADGRINYLELELMAGPLGEVRIADGRHLLSPETWSDLIRHMMKPLLERQGEELADGLATLSEMTKRLRAEDHEDVVSLYQDLPPELKRRRDAQWMRGEALLHIDEAAFLAAMADYERAFPNDPGLDLMRLDTLFVKGEYDTLLEVVDRIDRMVGGDPYLDVLRASAVAVKTQDATQALPHARRAAEREPDLRPAHEKIAELAAAQGDWSAVAEALDALARHGGDPRDEAALRAGGLGPFLDSEVGRKWLESR